MNKKIKKGLIIFSSVLFLLIAALIILPFTFKEKITAIATQNINGMLNAKVGFDNVDISFLRSFPNVSVQLENFQIIGKGEFAKDTLLQSEDIDFVLNIKSLFSKSGYEVRRLTFINSRLFAHVLSNGKANWDIMKEDSNQQTPDTSAMSFNLKLKEFNIKNADIIYLDEESNMKAVLQKLNHQTSGDLTADSSLLATQTTIDSLNFWMDGMQYLSKAYAELNAEINADLNNKIFKFDRNSSRINGIPFAFKGWFQMLNEGYDMDLTLNTEKVDFKAILSMIPDIYAQSFEEMKAGGKVNMSGFVKGKMVGDYYPAFDFKLTATDGWFQYPSLPKSLQKINVAGHISNPGKTLDATVIDISKFSFLMGKNPFSAQLHIAYPISDPEFTMKATGKLNLGNIKEIYPLDEKTQLNGLLDMNINLGGRMSSYETNQYEKFKFSGNMNMSNMLVKMTSLPQDLSISKASMVFNNRYVDLATLQMKIGRNDIAVSGKLENAVAYALRNKTLIGSLNFQSNYFNVSDFMTSEKTTTATTDTSKLKTIVIPKNIDFNFQATFKKLIYDKMNISNAKASLKVANGDMIIQNMSLEAFGGSLTIKGLYGTNNPQKPLMNMDMTLSDVLFTDIFKQVETIQKFAPIFEKATGRFSTKLSFKSLLKNDMTPDLASFIGNGSFSTKSIGLTNIAAITKLVSALNQSKQVNTSIKDLGLSFDIKDGQVNTKPFDVKIGDLKMKLGGRTGLDKTIAYSGTVELPSKLNLGQYSTVNVKVGGTFSQPKVDLDLKNTLKNVVADTKAKAMVEINKKIDTVKPQAIKAAQEQADRLRADAKAAGDRLLSEAKASGDQLIEKAGNPITKKMAQIAAQKLLNEAQKKVDILNSRADEKAKETIQKAADGAVLK